VRAFDDERYVMMATRSGIVKKTSLSAFSRPMKKGIIAIGLRENDALLGVAIGKPGDEVILGTKQGMAIRFKESDVRAMGRTATGVGGISLREGDEVVDMVIVDPSVEGATLLTACENGHGKRTPVSEYRLQHRNGTGTINIKTTERNGFVVGMKAVTDADDLVLMTQNGIILRIAAASMRSIGRATQGVRLIRLEEGDKLISIERVVKEENGEEGAAVEELPPEDEEGAPEAEPGPPPSGGGG
jgi:DNA gyrase subunit A